ncbi:hypothetical protein SAMN05216571_108129 [Onishia taeanensis]|uniref:Uncharacterized protein n=1 Tax=Onishia taeanensis TaxID=284577 RepID=A0A1G7T259_9GAMM|nr:hypothetical protein SAMN05216571_108129 [Halomonas taeanensis]
MHQGSRPRSCWAALGLLRAWFLCAFMQLLRLCTGGWLRCMAQCKEPAEIISRLFQGVTFLVLNAYKALGCGYSLQSIIGATEKVRSRGAGVEVALARSVITLQCRGGARGSAPRGRGCLAWAEGLGLGQKWCGERTPKRGVFSHNCLPGACDHRQSMAAVIRSFRAGWYIASRKRSGLVAWPMAQGTLVAGAEHQGKRIEHGFLSA